MKLPCNGLTLYKIIFHNYFLEPYYDISSLKNKEDCIAYALGARPEGGSVLGEWVASYCLDDWNSFIIAKLNVVRCESYNETGNVETLRAKLILEYDGKKEYTWNEILNGNQPSEIPEICIDKGAVTYDNVASLPFSLLGANELRIEVGGLNVFDFVRSFPKYNEFGQIVRDN